MRERARSASSVPKSTTWRMIMIDRSITGFDAYRSRLHRGHRRFTVALNAEPYLPPLMPCTLYKFCSHVWTTKGSLSGRKNSRG